MNKYRVSVRFKPNYNRAESVTREILVEAKNREDAAFVAGNQLGLQGTGLVPSSLVMDVERQRRL